MSDFCVSAFLEGADGLDPDALKEVRKEVNRRLRQRIAEDERARLDAGLAAQEVANELADELQIAAMIDKRNAFINLQKRVANEEFLNGFSDPAEGLQAMLVGINKVRQGGRLSVDAKAKGMFEQHFGAFINDLDEAGVLHAFRFQAFDRQVAQELWELGREGGRPGISGNRQAQEIARIVRKHEDLMVDRQNRAGSFIRKAAGYIVRQSHDVFKLRSAGYEEWKNFILPRLDDLTFRDVEPEEVEQFLRGIYDGLISGVHLKPQGEDASDIFQGFKGPGNLGKRLSQNRKLHFKSADDWSDYNERFGGGSLKESLIIGMERETRNVALMEQFGTNPEAMFNALVEKARRASRDDPKVSERLKGNLFNQMYDEVSGATRVPVNLSGARIGAVLRAIQNMSKLGGATISAISDIPMFASEMRYQGRGLFEAYAEAFRNSLGGFRSADQKRLARLVGVGLDGMRGDILARFGAVDNLPGGVSRLQNLFFRLNLLSWWTDSHKTGAGLMMASHLNDFKGVPLDGMDPDMQRVLRQFGLTDDEWGLVRARDWFTDEEGRGYFTPDIIQQISDEEIARFLGKQSVGSTTAQRFRDQLQSKFSAFFADRVDFAVPTPGAREFRLLRMGTRPGTIMGEAMRLIMQFKTFPITVLTRPIAREIYGRGADSVSQALTQGKTLVPLAHMIVATTVMGYLAQSAKQLVKGREPRDPTLPATWMAAMAQGGGAGIYGDFLFGEFNRFGRSFSSTMLGPTVGQIDDLADIYTRIKQGDDFAAQSFQTIINNAPFMNLFYTRAALDYLVLYQIQEQLNPGYLRRLERRLEDDNNQRFFLPPSEVVR